MHAGQSSDKQDSIWPGYVAAMSSLLLGLLLVTAVLVITVGQIGSLSDSYMKAINKYGMTSAKEVEAAINSVGLTENELEKFQEVNNASKADRLLLGTTKATNNVNQASSEELKPRLDLENGLFSHDAARQAANLALADREILSQIDLSKIELQKIKIAEYDFSRVRLDEALSSQVLEKIDFSEVDWGYLTQGRIVKLRPIIAKEVIRRKLQKNKFEYTSIGPSLKTEASKNISLELPILQKLSSTASKEAATDTNRLKVTFFDESLELPEPQRNELNKFLSDPRRQGALIHMSTQISSHSDFLYRAAFSRLMLIKKNALDQGFPMQKISLEIARSDLLSSDVKSLEFYITVVPQ